MIGKTNGKIMKLGLAALVALSAGAAAAQDMDRAVKARKSLMTLYAHYLGTLGGMAKGEIAYDSAGAASAAASLAALSTADQSAMWPQGSDNAALGMDKTEALPVIWTTYPAITEKAKALAEAAANLSAVAGNDLAALQGAMGPVGASCGGCHKEFRQPKG